MSVVRFHLGPLIIMVTEELFDKLEYMSKIKVPQEKRQKMKDGVESFIARIRVLEEVKNKKF